MTTDRKVTRRNVWNDIANLAKKRLNNSTKYLLHASMTTTSKKKKWNPWENCHKYAPKLVWNVENLARIRKWTNLHDRSQNGPKLVTNDYLVWPLTFITHVNTGNIVMWVTLHNNADWDCFRTLILPEIQKTQNQHQVELCAFLEVTRFCQEVECARNRLQFHTVLQKLK